MSSFLGKNVLITGGANGIGKLIAEKALQAEASNVIIWDIDRQQLDKIPLLYPNSGSKIHTYVIDLTQKQQVKSTAQKVLNDIGPVHILFNNAGIVIGKYFAEYTHEEIQQLIDLNVLGVMHTTRAFLPSMMEQREGHIVNVASAASLLGNPRMSVYTGSKWAVTGWSESLRLELESLNTNIYVTTVQPSYINTGMFEGVKAPRLTPLLEPEYVVNKIIRAVRENKRMLREPFMVKLIPFLKGVLPSPAFDFIAGKLFGVYGSMDSFTGRKKS